MRLNLGCSDRHLPGYVNVDICEPADRRCDLSITPWRWIQDVDPSNVRLGPRERALYDAPAFETSSVDEIVAHDIIEHLPNKIQTMNEIWRVLKPGAVSDIIVPTTDGRGAWQDPTHVSYWNRNSMYYYTHGDAHRERFGKAYGIEARFNVVYENQYSSGDNIVHLHIKLEAVKP